MPIDKNMPTVKCALCGKPMDSAEVPYYDRCPECWRLDCGDERMRWEGKRIVPAQCDGVGMRVVSLDEVVHGWGIENPEMDMIDPDNEEKRDFVLRMALNHQMRSLQRSNNGRPPIDDDPDNY